MPSPFITSRKRVPVWIMAMHLVLIVCSLMLLPRASAQNRGRGTGRLYIAFAGPLTGPDSRYGREMRNAVDMRVEEINAAGGVNGKKVKVLVFDDENDEEKAGEVARRISEDNRILLVIGHMRSDPSVAAGPIYKEHRIPAITSVATAGNVTRGNPWYFRVIFDNERQGSMLASYISQILRRDIASIVYDEGAFGRDLSESFERATDQFGLTVNYKWSVDRNQGDLEKQLDDIVNEMKETSNIGVVFLALHTDEAVGFIKRIRTMGLDPPLVGGDALAKRVFPLLFKDFPLEKSNPGLCTNGLYVASYYIFDTTCERGRKVREKYIETFETEPNDSSMSTYDAVSLGLKAIEETGVVGESPSGDREKIRDYLAGLDGVGNAFKGISGSIYFDEEGNAQKSVPIALFKNNRLISAPVQLNPVDIVKEAGKGKHLRIVDGSVNERLDTNDDILFFKGMHFRKTDYVYTGVHVNEINALDFDNLLFDMDFFLWFRFAEGADPWNITFLNTLEPLTLGEPIIEEKTGGVVYRKYHVKGRFKADFFSRPPLFGRHILGVSFRHKELARDQLMYIVDELGIDAGCTGKAAACFLNPVTGWTVSDISFFQDAQEVSAMGDPLHLSDVEGKVDYSRFNLGITVKEIQLSFRGLIKNIPANYALLLVGVASILLMELLNGLGKYEHWTKVVFIVEMTSTALSLLSGETLLLDALKGKIGNYGLGRVKQVFDILWWLAPAYFGSRAFKQFIVHPLEKRTGRRVSTLLTFFVKFLIYLMAFFGIVAFVFDQKLTSLLGASGVLAMIIGLAIQINISNIFSGIAINLERPFRVGDWVTIGSETGQVKDVTWRATRVLTPAGNIISIPNSVASESVVVNYNYPDEMNGHTLTVRVGVEHETKKIKAILMGSVKSISGIIAPSIVFKGFRNRTSEYDVFFKIRDYSKKDAYLENAWKNMRRNLKTAGVEFASR